MFGDVADRDVVDSAARDLGDVGEPDSTGNLDLHSALVAPDRLGSRLKGEVVEQDDVRLGAKGFAELVHVLDLYLDDEIRPGNTRALNRDSDTARGSDVVFLDQVRVVQPGAMIANAADGSGVFLGGPQAGDGLARVEDLGLRAGDSLGIGASPRGGPGQELGEIQDRPLGCQQAAGGTRELHQGTVRD